MIDFIGLTWFIYYKFDFLTSIWFFYLLYQKKLINVAIWYKLLYTKI